MTDPRAGMELDLATWYGQAGHLPLGRAAPAPARGPWPPSGNLAVGALHLAGRHDTTEATRWASRNINHLESQGVTVRVVTNSEPVAGLLD